MVINIAQLHLTESELSFSLYFIYCLADPPITMSGPILEEKCVGLSDAAA